MISNKSKIIRIYNWGKLLNLLLNPYMNLLGKIKKQKISHVKDGIKVNREMKQIIKYDDDERELDDFYFTTNEKDLQSNRNITPHNTFHRRK